MTYTETPIHIGPKRTIARWECRRGRTWIELHAEEVNGRPSYSLASSWGERRVLGMIALSRAMMIVEERADHRGALHAKVDLPTEQAA